MYNHSWNEPSLKCVDTFRRVRIGAFLGPTDRWRASIWVCIALEKSFRHPKNPSPVQYKNHISRPSENRLWADLTGFEACVPAKNRLRWPKMIITRKYPGNRCIFVCLRPPENLVRKYSLWEKFWHQTLWRGGELRSSAPTYAWMCTRTLKLLLWSTVVVVI